MSDVTHCFSFYWYQSELGVALVSEETLNNSNE